MGQYKNYIPFCMIESKGKIVGGRPSNLGSLRGDGKVSSTSGAGGSMWLVVWLLIGGSTFLSNMVLPGRTSSTEKNQEFRTLINIL